MLLIAYLSELDGESRGRSIAAPYYHLFGIHTARKGVVYALVCLMHYSGGSSWIAMQRRIYFVGLPTGQHKLEERTLNGNLIL
jgi:hypothetical protein